MAKETISTTRTPGAASSKVAKNEKLTSNDDPQLVNSTTEKFQDAAPKKRLDLYRKVMKYSKPLNILVVGAAGAGKSSFINSCNRAIRKKTGEWATVGLGGDMANITTVLRRINMYFPDLHNSRIRSEGGNIDAPDAGPIAVDEAPNIIDVCGMPNENTELVRAVLRLLLYGHFELDKHNILDIQKDADQKNPSELLDKYSSGREELHIHRVIFVADANAALPIDLMRAVMETARPLTHDKDGIVSKRAVPVFGLMTKTDLVDIEGKNFKDRKGEFITALGLMGAERRFAMNKNYVSQEDEEEDEEEENDSAIDQKLLKFLCNVCDPSHYIDNPDWTLQGAGNLEKYSRLCIGIVVSMLSGLGPFFRDAVKVHVGIQYCLPLILCLMIILVLVVAYVMKQ